MKYVAPVATQLSRSPVPDDSYGLVSSITADRPGRVRRSAVTTDTNPYQTVSLQCVVDRRLPSVERVLDRIAVDEDTRGALDTV